MNGFTIKNDPTREGFALVTALLVVLVLSILAVGVAWLAGTEKKTSFAEGVHIEAVFTADAGGEAAINFLRTSETPPIILDTANNLVRNQGSTLLHDSQSYEFEAYYAGPASGGEPLPGWDPEKYREFEYDVDTHGEIDPDGAGNGRDAIGDSDITMVVGRLYQVGY